MRLCIVLFVLIAGLSACDGSKRPAVDQAPSPTSEVQITLPQPSPEPLLAPTDEELKACAAGADVVAARRQAADDVARGEWRYSTFVEGGFGVMTTAPGVKNCLPVLMKGHDRHRQLGFCGDVSGGPYDCSCAQAEQKWRAAYNAEISRLVKNAFERNCVSEDRVLNCDRGPPGECEELALTRIQRQAATPPELTGAD